MSARLRTVLAAVAAATLLTACTSSESGDDAGATSATETATAGAEVAEDLQASAGPDAEPQPVPADLPVVATRSTSHGSIPVEIDLNSVSAAGEVMTVVFTVRNVGDDNDWQISDYFDDGLYTTPLDEDGTRSEESDTIHGSTTDGVSVVDTTNGTMYRAAYDAAGNCACNVDLGGKFVDPGQELVLTTMFAAPPEDVETVTVQIPGAGAFTDVPLTR